MSDIAASLHELTAPVRGEKTRDIINRAKRLGGFKKYSRAYEIWYRRAKRVTNEEIERVASALEKKRREAARNEIHELKIRLAALESRLCQADADFHRPSIDALRSAVRQGG